MVDAKQKQLDLIKTKVLNNEPISDGELAFVKKFISPQKENGSEIKGLSSLKKDTGSLKKVLGEMGSILNIPLNERGETVHERFLAQVYGPKNVRVTKNGFTVSPDGKNFIPSPDPAIVSQVGGFGIDVASGILGEQTGAAIGGTIGATVGPFAGITIPLGVAAGAGVGAAAGTAIGDAYNKTSDALLARKLGLIQDSEIPSFLKNASKDTLVLSGISGGITGILRAAVPEPARVLARSLRVKGSTGREIGQLKAAVIEQDLVDRLFKSVEGLPDATNKAINSFGQTTKQIVKQVTDSIKQSRNQMFNEADQGFRESLAKGEFEFADVSRALDDFSKDLTPALTSLGDEFIQGGSELQNQVIDRVRDALNFTKKSILKGNLDSAAAQKFIIKDPLSSKIVSNTGFDPKQVTAFDFRHTLNEIGSIFDEMNIKSDSSTGRALARFRTSLGSAIGDFSGAIQDTAIETGERITNAIPIKTPNTGGFDLYKKAFTEGKRLYDEVGTDILKISTKLTDSEFGKSIRALPRESAFKLRTLIDNAGEDVKTLFDKTLRYEILNDEKIINRQRTRNVVKNISDDALIQSRAIDKTSAEALESRGTKLKLGPVKEAVADPLLEGLPKERGIIGKGLSDLLQFNATDNVLLGKKASGLQTTANKLAELQDQSGRISTLQDSAKTGFNTTGEVTQNVLESFIPQGKGMSKLLSSVVNPAQRGMGNALDLLASPANPLPRAIGASIEDLFFTGEDESAQERLRLMQGLKPARSSNLLQK